MHLLGGSALTCSSNMSQDHCREIGQIVRYFIRNMITDSEKQVEIQVLIDLLGSHETRICSLG